ncbi:MAG: hypothetical protein WC994_10220, partial [Brumimicrobium sp.]
MKINYVKFLGLFIVGFATSIAMGQDNVGIGTTNPEPSSILELKSNNKGVLVPRVTTLQRNAIPNPAEALLVYDTDIECFYFYKTASSTWESLCASGTGTQGPMGPQGPAGADGVDGETPVIGTNGNWWIGGTDTGIAATGPAGAQGPQGDPGPAGPTGAQGPQGDPGPAGPAGPAGAQGPQGDPGPAGPAGAQGPQGDPGPAGPAGAQGPQ